jgi:hypothetical protein
MSQTNKPLAQNIQDTAKRQVNEVVRVSEDAVTSGAWVYPIKVSFLDLLVCHIDYVLICTLQGLIYTATRMYNERDGNRYQANS